MTWYPVDRQTHALGLLLVVSRVRECVCSMMCAKMYCAERARALSLESAHHRRRRGAGGGDHWWHVPATAAGPALSCASARARVSLAFGRCTSARGLFIQVTRTGQARRRRFYAGAAAAAAEFLPSSAAARLTSGRRLITPPPPQPACTHALQGGTVQLVLFRRRDAAPGRPLRPRVQRWRLCRRDCASS